MDYRSKDIEENLIFEDESFTDKVLFQYCTLSKSLLFKNCKFFKDIVFGEDVSSQLFSFIGQDLVFENCVFYGRVMLEGLRCDGSVYIKHCISKYRSKRHSDFALSLACAKINGCVELSNSKFEGGLSFNCTHVYNINCCLICVSVINENACVQFTSAELANELSIKGCYFKCDIVSIDNVHLDDNHGRLILDKYKLGDVQGIDFGVFELPKQERNSHIVEFITQVGGEVEHVKSFFSTPDRIEIRDDNDRAFYIYAFDNSTIGIFQSTSFSANNVSLCYSKTGAQILLSDSIIAAGEIDSSHCKSNGTVIITGVTFQTPQEVNFNNLVVSGSLNVKECRLINPIVQNEQEKPFLFSFYNLQVGSECQILSLRGGKNVKTLNVDLSFSHVGGELRIDDIVPKNIQKAVFVLQSAETRSCDLFKKMSDCEKYVPVELEMEGFNAGKVTLLGHKTPKISLLQQVIPQKYSSKKLKDQRLVIRKGLIPFLRMCQDHIIKQDDDFTEANKIWRLRNKIRIKIEHSSKLSYFASYLWNYFTDFGLSSRRILYFAVFLLLGLLVLNIYVFYAMYAYYHLPEQQTILSCLGQSLLQFISSINFTAKNLVEAEEYAPHWYQVLIVLFRITGFVLTSILVGSSTDLWKGRNK